MRKLFRQTSIFLSLVFLSYYSMGQGSGRAAKFTGTEYINIPNSSSFNHSSNNISVEAWINPSAYPSGSDPSTNSVGTIVSKAYTVGSREYYVGLLTDGKLRVAIFNSGSSNYLGTSTVSIPLNTWTHIAFSYAGSTGILKIFINGMLNINTTAGSTTIATTTTNPLIGAMWGGGTGIPANVGPNRYFFSGMIDEVRIWDILRSKDDIQSDMCHKLAGTETGLKAYYRLDEIFGTTTADATSGANTGTFTLFPSSETSSRSYSGAPIGNVSTKIYKEETSPDWTGTTLTLTSSTPLPAAGPIGSMTVKNINGTPNGVHIYRVNQIPSQTAGVNRPAGGYYGVFIVNVTTPTTIYSYQSAYQYTPYNTKSCGDSIFSLHTRNDNSVTPWDLTIHGGHLRSEYTLIRSNATRNEFILDSLCHANPPRIGSGRAAKFTGSEYINIPNSLSFAHTSNNISAEAWINPSAYPSGSDPVTNTLATIVSKAYTVGSREYYMGIDTDGKVRTAVFDYTGSNPVATSISTIPLNKWSHVAFSYNGSTGITSIYINGVLDNSVYVGNITIANTDANPLIGAIWGGGTGIPANVGPNRYFFSGLIDEVKIWDIERTQASIQNDMCHSLKGTEWGLKGYYPLDEENGTVAGDYTLAANDGTFTSFPSPEITNRSYSGAAIGDVSINLYKTQPASWSGQTLTLDAITLAPSAPQNIGSLQMKNITGTPDGIHIYRVNHQPEQAGNLNTPAAGYYGTFVANVKTPATSYSYNSVYNYSPYSSGCISSYVVKARNDNSVASWSILATVNNTSAYTLFSANTNIRREYILEMKCPSPRISEDAELTTSSLIQVFPNPNNGLVNISVPERGQLIIYNMVGETIMKKDIELSTASLDLKNLPGGIYNVVFHGESKSYEPVKWIKE